MFFCEMATMLPTVIVIAAMNANTYCISPCANPDCPITNSTRKILNSTTNPIFLEPVDRNMDTGVAAPSYTSGAHMWNGTAEILNP